MIPGGAKQSKGLAASLPRKRKSFEEVNATVVPENLQKMTGQNSTNPDTNAKPQQDGVKKVKHRGSAPIKVSKRDVEELGGSGLSGTDKKHFEAKQRERLGLKPVKQLKMPFKMRLGMQRKAAQRDDYKQEMMRQMGLDVRKQKKARVLKSNDAGVGGGKLRHSVGADIGRNKNGILNLSRKDIKNVKFDTHRGKRPVGLKQSFKNRR